MTQVQKTQTTRVWNYTVESAEFFNEAVCQIENIKAEKIYIRPYESRITFCAISLDKTCAITGEVRATDGMAGNPQDAGPDQPYVVVDTAEFAKALYGSWTISDSVNLHVTVGDRFAAVDVDGTSVKSLPTEMTPTITNIYKLSRRGAVYGFTPHDRDDLEEAARIAAGLQRIVWLKVNKGDLCICAWDDDVFYMSEDSVPGHSSNEAIMTNSAVHIDGDILTTVIECMNTPNPIRRNGTEYSTASRLI